jgi:UDP-3-O-[3-hydroxymyristoyl] N-acetylglucosamine deacetylase
MLLQSTVNDTLELKGIGLHNGEKTKVVVFPAPINTGIVFLPLAKDNRQGVKAHYSNILDTSNAITIGSGLFNIKTVEHFMAAFYAFGITNAYVKVEGQEMPILDGSARKVVRAIEKTGVRAQNGLLDVFHIPYPIWVEENSSYLVALPNSQFKVTYTIDFSLKSEAIGTQTAHFSVDKETFKHSIAPARTFGFYEEIEHLKKNNLALGGSLDNALVFTKDGLINDGLRFSNECVRHKILDLIGDLALIGYRLSGHFIAHKAGHSMDLELVKKIDRVMRRKRRIRVIPKEILRRKEFEFNQFKNRMNLT